MQLKPLMKRSAFLSRRKAVIFIIFTMLIMGVVSGVSNPFITDNNIYKPTYGEVIVMEEAPPASGSPSDYDLLSNLKYTAYKLHHAPYFRGETEGVAVADIGITEYSQYLTNTRVVKGENTVFTQTTSYSSLKSLGEQQYIEDGIIVLRQAKNVTSDSASFSDTAYQISYDDYSDSYGTIPNQLSKYIINTDTILSVADENNAAAPSSVTASAEEGVGFYVPEKLVRGADGYYRFTVSLDPEESTKYYRNEVRTRGGADQNPKFYYSYVTIVIDEKWNPVTVTTVENYDIAIPFLGPMNCTGTNVETFYDLYDENGTVPEQDFFRPYIDQAKDDPNFVPPTPPTPEITSPADYLAAAFADYLSGAKELELELDIENEFAPIYDMLLSVNLDSMNIRAMLGDLFVKYEDGKVYIKLNDINGYLPTEKFAELLNNDAVGSVLGSLGDLSKLDLSGIFGDDILSTVFKNCEMTVENGIARIHMPFTLDISSLETGLEEIGIDASILIDDETKALISVTGGITVGGTTADISATPLKRSPKYPSTDGAVDLSPALDFIPDIITTFGKPAIEINGSVSVMGTDLDISAYIDLTDGIKTDATVTAFGLDISIQYADGVIYASVGNIAACGTPNDLPELIAAIASLSDTDASSVTNAIKLLLPSSLNGFISMINSVEATETDLDIELKLLTFPVSISLERANGMLVGFSAGLDISLLGKTIDANIDLDITAPEPREITVPAEADCITVPQITSVLTDLMPYVKANGYTVTASGTVTANNKPYGIQTNFDVSRADDGFTASGMITALGQNIAATYADGVIYLSVGNIKFKLDTSNFDALKPSLKKLIAAIMPTFGSTGGDVSAIINGVMNAIKRVSFETDGTLLLIADISGETSEISLDAKNGRIKIDGSIKGVKLELTLDVSPVEKAITIVAPTDDGYIEATELAELIDKVAEIITQKALTASVTLKSGKTEINADLHISFGDGLKLELVCKTFPLEITLINGKLYAALGEIRIVGDKTDISSVIDGIKDILPANIQTIVSDLANGNADITNTVGSVVDAISSLDFDDGFSALISLGELGANITASKDLSALGISLTIGKTAITISADLEVKPAEIAVPADTFIDAEEIIPLLPYITEYAKSKAFALAFDGSAAISGTAVSLGGNILLDTTNGVKIGGAVTLFGQTAEIIYANDCIYAAVGNVKVKLNTTDISKLKSPVSKLLTALGINSLPALPNLSGGNTLQTVVSVINAITAFDVKDGVISIELDSNGNTVSADLTPENGTIELNVAASGIDFTATAVINVSDKRVTPPDDTTDHVDLGKFDVTIDRIADIITKKALTAKISATVGNTNITLDAAISFENGLKAEITEKSYGLHAVFINGTLYVSLGNIKISGTLDDIPDLMDALGSIVSDNVRSTVDSIVRTIEKFISKDGVQKAANGGFEIAATVKTILDSITMFAEKDDVLTVNLAFKDGAAQLRLPLSLGSVYVSAAVSDTPLAIDVTDIMPQKTDISIPDGEFALLRELIPTVKEAVPLAVGTGLKINVATLDVYGVNVCGAAYIYFGGASTPFAVRIDLKFGDLPVSLTLDNGNIYLSVGTTIKLYEKADKAVLKTIASKIASLFPADDNGESSLGNALQGITDLPEKLKALTVKDILSALSLGPVENGYALGADMTALGINAKAELIATNSDNTLCGLRTRVNAFGIGFDSTLDISSENGSLNIARSVTAETDIIGKFNVGLSQYGMFDTKINATEYIRLTDILKYIDLVLDIAKSARTAKSVALTIDNASITTPDNEYIKIGGTVYIDFAPLAVSANLTLFDGTDYMTGLEVKYVNGVVYLGVDDLTKDSEQDRSIMLSLDTAKDFKFLYDVLAKYLPPYINAEIAKLFGLSEGASAFSDISLIAEQLKAIADPDNTVKDIVSLLFAPLNNLSGDSTIKTLADMVNVFDRGNGTIGVGATLMGITLNAVPVLGQAEAEDGTVIYTLDGAAIDTNVFGCTVTTNIGFTLFDATSAIAPPENASAYVPVMMFAELIDSAVNTFTARQVIDGKETDNITFKIDSFDFEYYTYKIATEVNDKGETVNVKDEAGRDKPLTDEFGNKIVDKTITVNNVTGKPALRGKFEPVKDGNGVATGKYRFNLDAHIVLGLNSLTNSSPLTLELYIINNDEYNGLVYLDYTESNGYGERIRLDYSAIMEMVASAMQIMGVERSTTELLVGAEYMKEVDATVFESMNIAGLDNVKTLLNNLALGINDVKAALGNIESAWNAFYTAGSIQTLRARLDSIKTDISVGIDHIKTALARFDVDPDVTELPAVDEQTPTEPAQPEAAPFNGKLIHDIVTGVEFVCGNVIDESGSANSTYLSANIDNALVTQTTGTANVTVAQTPSAKGKVIDRIEVGGLDINTALLQNFDMRFSAGSDVTVPLPDNMESNIGNRTYSNMSDIKHLLFDVMNTANMLEFEIGGIDTSDRINLHLNIGADILASLDINIRYDAKVKIIETGKDENGKSLYKTAAAIEIHNKKAQAEILKIGSTIVVPECTTRLYFYDNMLYVQGIKRWTASNVKITTNLGLVKIYDKAGVITEYVDVMYTVDELMYMLSNDMPRFLDEFVYYLVPITTEKIAGILDVRSTISSQIGGSGGTENNPQKTIAQIFKGYTYNNGAHGFTIGLAELAGSTSLSDINIALTGANDNDENLLDNYIASAHIDTAIANVIEVNLDATLRNVSTPVVYYEDAAHTVVAQSGVTTEYARKELKSTGIGTLCLDYDKELFTYKGNKYVYVKDYTGNDPLIDNKHVQIMPKVTETHRTIEQLIADLLADITTDENGKIINAVNKPNGIQWTRPWQATYDAAQQQ